MSSCTFWKWSPVVWSISTTFCGKTSLYAATSAFAAFRSGSPPRDWNLIVLLTGIGVATTIFSFSTSTITSFSTSTITSFSTSTTS